MEMKSFQYDLSMYPSLESISDIGQNEEFVPPHLGILLESLIYNNLKRTSIGQAIVHASRPRSSLPPILFGIATEMDHVFRSKWLVKELNILGFSLNYDEIQRYKQSVIENENLNEFLKSVRQGTFSQWSADNVDHNVKTLDGKGSLHAMGIIVSTTGEGLANIDLPGISCQKKKVLLRFLQEQEYKFVITSLLENPKDCLVPLYQDVRNQNLYL